MKVTIVPINKRVVVDGKPKTVPDAPWAQMPPGVHAVQFKDSAGEIEFTKTTGGIKLPNQRITLDQFNAMFMPFVDAWKAVSEDGPEAA
ncbi:hypothetical protein [Filomicrobium sp.]|uniref:hypothetical protein n=1 Tax=Filomicrobium sp. TaxID=2024831 RepID=UPI00258F7445|nr:hypothetical protein [Filomicrobium sp.]MCV0371710.1 hypothetical protein [Filomicrobium sp.]